MKAKILKLDVDGMPEAFVCKSQLDMMRDVPVLTNERLFRRDANICMYCGDFLYKCELTRDYVVPVEKGGTDTWENVVTACRDCHSRKAGLGPDELDAIGMRLLAIPYAPNRAQYIILDGRMILADQMDFLRAYGHRRAALLSNI
jgi:hypothetical protein